MYYSYAPEDGIRFHDTAEEAKARAEELLDLALEYVADTDWTWSDNEDEISWGQVLQRVDLHERFPTPKEKKEHPEWDYVYDPKLENVE